MTESEFYKKHIRIWSMYLRYEDVHFVSYLKHNNIELNNLIEMYNEYSDEIDYSCELIVPNNIDNICDLYDSLKDFIENMYDYNHYFNKSDEYIYAQGDGLISTKSEMQVIEIILSKMDDMFNI